MERIALMRLALVLLFASCTLAFADEPVVLTMVPNSRAGCGPAKLDFARVRPDGTVSPDMFRIPTGQILIVNDVDWTFNGGAAGITKALVIYAENLTEATTRQAVFRSPVRLNGDGAGGASEHLSSGFPISSAARACPEVEYGPMASPLRLLSVILRGRLVPE